MIIDSQNTFIHVFSDTPPYSISEENKKKIKQIKQNDNAFYTNCIIKLIIGENL